MSTLHLRIPDEKHQRLKELAKAKNISVNKLMEELATMALAEYDIETRFKVRASRGSKEKALEVLEKLKEDYQDK
ncbi:MAG: toxin-antitoxin system HicB family antitoxin [Xenococcaceae cyanobacterium MO_188.B29]|nr:toxin-antitoxin system HicB family antitoxin [Xenococcaceae cyanobacterium MO_188.B29]